MLLLYICHMQNNKHKKWSLSCNNNNNNKNDADFGLLIIPHTYDTSSQWGTCRYSYITHTNENLASKQIAFKRTINTHKHKSNTSPQIFLLIGIAPYTRIHTCMYPQQSRKTRSSVCECAMIGCVCMEIVFYTRFLCATKICVCIGLVRESR